MSNKTFGVLLDGVEIAGDDNNNIGQILFDMRLEVNNIVTLYPFNHFDDEPTDHKPDPEEYHFEELCVDRIERMVINSWNNSIRTHIVYHLRSPNGEYHDGL